MLLLIITYRDDLCIIEENVRRHENRIHEKTCRSGFLFFAFLLKLCHSRQFPRIGAACQNPGQLGMSGNIGLYKYRRFFWIHAHRQIESRHVAYAFSEFFRILRYCNRMQIHDTVDAVAVVLQFYELLQRSQIISDMYIARRLNSGKYSFHR